MFKQFESAISLAALTFTCIWWGRAGSKQGTAGD
jgi:hypothetical protein